MSLSGSDAPATIVFVDRDTLDAGDLDFSALEACGELVSHGVTAPPEVEERIAGASVVLTNKVVIGSAAMDAAPGLKLIQIAATGVNNVDLEAARERGIAVCNVSGYSTPSVAQHVFALLLNLVTQVHRYDAERAGWPRSPHFTRLDHPVIELRDRTLGIAGLGTIGKEVAAIGAAFGMRVVGLQREDGPPARAGASYPRVPWNRFFRESDVVSLHCPLTSATHHMIDRESLALMKPSAFLINTGRGDLVNEADLLEALKSNVIAGAGIDVLSVEPPLDGHPLLDPSLKNLLVTPHTAWTSLEARARLLAEMVENIRAFEKGGERNSVA